MSKEQIWKELSKVYNMPDVPDEAKGNNQKSDACSGRGTVIISVLSLHDS